MTDAPPGSRSDAATARLRAALARIDPQATVLAVDVLGLDARIDLVARDAEGGVWILLLAEPGRDLERWADALAQAAWLAPRLADWHQIAPERGLRPERGIRAAVVAAEFEARTLAAAESLGAAAPRLVRSAPDGGRGHDVPAESPEPGRRAPAGRGARSVFRTGLEPRDF